MNESKYSISIKMSGKSPDQKKPKLLAPDSNALRGWEFFYEDPNYVLASGNYGEVRIVMHQSLQNTLFVMKSQPLEDEEDEERWNLEIDTTEMLYTQHGIGPAFVDAWLTEGGAEGGAGHSVAELWDGSLNNSVIPMKLFHIQKIEREVQRMHQLGLVHCDLYGRNVLIRYISKYQHKEDNGDTYKKHPQAISDITLTDFGLTKPFADMQRIMDEAYDDKKSLGAQLADQRTRWLRVFFTAEPALLGEAAAFRNEYPSLKKFANFCPRCLIGGVEGTLCQGCKLRPDFWNERPPERLLKQHLNYFYRLMVKNPFVHDTVFVWMLHQIPKFKSVCEQRLPGTSLPPIVCLQCNIQNVETYYKCGRCNKAAYCGQQCQAAHWKSIHKVECGTAAQDAFRLYRLL